MRHSKAKAIEINTKLTLNKQKWWWKPGHSAMYVVFKCI